MSKTGTVKKFFGDKGFGFISTDGGEDVFIHVKDLLNCEALAEGDQVMFDTRYDDRKGKWKACNCTQTVSSCGGGGGSVGYGGGGGSSYGAKGKGKGGGDRYSPYGGCGGGYGGEEAVPPRPGFGGGFSHNGAGDWAAAASQGGCAGSGWDSQDPAQQLSAQVQSLAASQLQGLAGWGADKQAAAAGTAGWPQQDQGQTSPGGWAAAGVGGAQVSSAVTQDAAEVQALWAYLSTLGQHPPREQ